MSENHPDWQAIVNKILVDFESRLEQLEQIVIDFNDFEYAVPGENLRTAYDLRTGPERTAAQMEDYQRRIAQLEQRIAHLERVTLTPGYIYADKSSDDM